MISWGPRNGLGHIHCEMWNIGMANSSIVLLHTRALRWAPSCNKTGHALPFRSICLVHNRPMCLLESLQLFLPHSVYLPYSRAICLYLDEDVCNKFYSTAWFNINPF
jgi:hypothetical protein